MKLYSYCGPVKEFNTIINSSWYGETWALSEKHARSNLTYQYKKYSGKGANSKITLPGTLTMEGIK